MRQIAHLFKKDFLNSFLMRIPYFWKTKKERKKLLLIPFFGILFGVYIYLAIQYIINWIGPYDKAGFGHVYLNQPVLAYTALAIMSIVGMIISNLYYSNDISILLPLPVSKRNILISKIIYNSFIALSTALFMIVPFMVKYGIYYNKGIDFYITFILGVIAHTIIITSIFTLLIVAMMSVVNRFPKAKNFLQVFGTIIIVAVSFGVSYLINSNVQDDGIPATMIEALAGKMDQATKYVPTIDLIYQGSHGKILSLILLIALALGLTFLVSSISGKMLAKGILSNQVVSKRKKLSSEEKVGVFKKGTVFGQIIRKELRDILKTPVYFTSTLLFGIIFPIALIVPLIAQGLDVGGFVSQANMMFKQLESIMSIKELFGYILMGTMVILMFMSSSASNTAGTSITREGKYLWILQTIPVKADTQISARVLAAVIVYLLSILPVTLIILILVRPPYYAILAYKIGVLIVGFFSACFGILIDTLRPKTDWQTPQQAMKSNFNAIGLTYGTMIIAAILGFITFKLVTGNLTNDQIFLAIIIVAVTLLVIALVFYHLAVRTFEKKLPRYE